MARNQEVEGVTAEATEAPAKVVKLSVDVDESKCTWTLGETGETLFLDVNELPDNVKFELMMHGAKQKVGDSAAGRSTEESKTRMTAVIDALKRGEWTTRTPAAPKISKKALGDKLNSMSPEEAEAARALLERLGVKL